MEIIIVDCDSLLLLEPEKLSVLPKSRLKSIDSYVSDKDKALCAGSGFLMRYIEKRFGVKIAAEINGKPQTDKKDLNFNISHSGKYVVCAISDYPVGIDIEAISDYEGALDLSLTDAEKRIFENIPDKEKQKSFFRLWTAKESYLKAIGKGLSVPMDSFQILFENEIKSNFDDWKITEIHSVDGYALSVSHNPNDEVVSIKFVDGINLVELRLLFE